MKTLKESDEFYKLNRNGQSSAFRPSGPTYPVGNLREVNLDIPTDEFLWREERLRHFDLYAM
jgi:hypothetical protein